jgi:hypothetical protein
MDTAVTTSEAPVFDATNYSDCTFWGAEGSAGLTAATKVTLGHGMSHLV